MVGAAAGLGHLTGDATDGVACPACRAPLCLATEVSHCVGCGADYPSLGGVPCLLPDPAGFVATWRRRLAVMTTEGRRTIEMFEAQARKPALLASTRTRLEAQARIAAHALEDVTTHLRTAVGEPLHDDRPVPPFTPLDTLHFLFRDWGWPDSDENERAFAAVQAVLPPRLGRTLVLGCGGARLADDLHRAGATQTWALDIDPFVLVLARRVLAGQTVPLLEGRANATDLDALSAVRELRLPKGRPPASGVRLVLGDGLDPPFSDAVFDTVVTPWFIDVVPADLRDFLPRLARLLAPGGHWINFGPLLYPAHRPASVQFSWQEVSDLAARVGLATEAREEVALPFARSTLTGRGRIESCTSFRARRGPPRPAMPGEPPSWLVFASLPIPREVAECRPTSAVARRIVVRIDGERSIDDLAAELGRSTPATPLAVVKDAVRECLARLIESTEPSRISHAAGMNGHAGD